MKEVEHRYQEYRGFLASNDFLLPLALDGDMSCNKEWIDSFLFVLERAQMSMLGKSPIQNIARGTTDPGHSLYNLNHFSDRNQFEGGLTCIGSKLDQDVM